MSRTNSTDELVTKEDCDGHTKLCYKTNIKPIMEEIKNLGKQLNNFEKKMIKVVAEMPGKMEGKFDNRYANKKTEKNVDKMMWLIIAAVAVGILNLVLK